MLCPVRPAVPDCDSETLTRALVCLLNDALSCTDPSCSVVFSGDIHDDHICFLVSDDGGSLPEEELQSIFHVPGSELELSRQLMESCRLPHRLQRTPRRAQLCGRDTLETIKEAVNDCLRLLSITACRAISLAKQI